MAAHAAQFAFLALFENPRTSTSPVRPLLFSLSRSQPSPYLHAQTSNDSMENASSLQSANPSPLPPLNASNASLPSNAPLSSNAPALSQSHPSPALLFPRKRPSIPMDPCLIAAWTTALLDRTPLRGRPKLPSTICSTSILGRMSSCGITWIGSGASILPGNATPKRYIYICVGQDVRLPTCPVNHIHHRMRTPNTYRCPPSTLGTGPPPHARAPLAALPHVRARLVTPGTISEQVCRAPFCEELLLPT